MIVNLDFLDVVIDVELQFKIQLAAIPHRPKSFVLMTNGKWPINYTHGGSEFESFGVINNIITALYNEFEAGDEYMFWWVVKHMIRIFAIRDIYEIYLLFKSSDIDQFIDYGGIGNDTHGIDILRVKAIHYNNFGALEKLYYGDTFDPDSVEAIRNKVIKHGNVDTLAWCESRGMSFIMDCSQLKFVHRLDIAQYLYSRNPDWFGRIHNQFTISDLAYYCVSITNRETALIEWLIEKMKIDVLYDLNRDKASVIDIAYAQRDISLMCWLIDNYADTLQRATDAEADHILKQTLYMMSRRYDYVMRLNIEVYSYADNPLLSEPFRRFASVIFPDKPIDFNKFNYLDVSIYSSLLPFLVNRGNTVGFTTEHANMLAIHNHIDDLKRLHSMYPHIVNVHTFYYLIENGDRDVLNWAISCLDLNNDETADHFRKFIIYHLHKLEDKDFALWLYNLIEPTESTNGLVMANMEIVPECCFLNQMGMINYDFMKDIAPDDLKRIIRNHLECSDFAILRSMRNANATLFDQCIDYAEIKRTISSSMHSQLIYPWLVYDCGHKILTVPRFGKGTLKNYMHKFIAYKIYAEQNVIPFSKVYAELA